MQFPAVEPRNRTRTSETPIITCCQYCPWPHARSRPGPRPGPIATQRVDAGGSPTTHGACASSTVNGSPSPRAAGDNNRFSSNSEYTSHAVQAVTGKTCIYTPFTAHRPVPRGLLWLDKGALAVACYTGAVLTPLCPSRSARTPGSKAPSSGASPSPIPPSPSRAGRPWPWGACRQCHRDEWS